jgi:hypothetical protein
MGVCCSNTKAKATDNYDNEEKDGSAERLKESMGFEGSKD